MWKKMCSENQINNTAIGSWSGFIYQGLCALYHCLRLIKHDKERCKELKLSLDSFEDFAILDQYNDPISLHQCKNKSGTSGYKDEFKKMREKKRTYNDDDRCFLFFHSNKRCEISDDDVIAYPFTDEQNYCGPVRLMKLIENIVRDITQADELTCRKKTSVLYKKVDEKVLRIHYKFLNPMNDGERLRDIAKIEFIPLNDIIEELDKQETVVSLMEDDFLSYIKNTMKVNLVQNLNDEDESVYNEDLVYNFISKVNKMDNKDFRDLLKRLYPDCNFNNRDLELLINVANDRAFSALYDVLSGTSELSDRLDWCDNSQKETPTALGMDKKIAKVCRLIYENSNNVKILYEYDWLVGNVSEKVDQIGQEPKCTRYKVDNPDNIFNKKKIGILRIEDKKNGNY